MYAISEASTIILTVLLTVLATLALTLRLLTANRAYKGDTFRFRWHVDDFLCVAALVSGTFLSSFFFLQDTSLTTLFVFFYCHRSSSMPVQPSSSGAQPWAPWAPIPVPKTPKTGTRPQDPPGSFWPKPSGWYFSSNRSNSDVSASRFSFCIADFSEPTNHSILSIGLLSPWFRAGR